jgi:hypothetical protein
MSVKKKEVLKRVTCMACGSGVCAVKLSPLGVHAGEVLKALKEIVGIEWAQDPESRNVRDEHLKQYEALIKKAGGK